MNVLVPTKHLVFRRKLFGVKSAATLGVQVRKLNTFQVVADAFVSVHEFSGIPWLLLVPLSTFALRTVFTLPLSIWQRRRIVKQQGLRKVVQAIPPVVKLRLAAASQNTTESSFTSSGSAVKEQDVENVKVMRRGQTLTPDQITLLALKETRNRQKKLFAKYNVAMWKNAVLPLVQIPLWVSISMGLRKLTENRLLDSNIASLGPFNGASATDLLSYFSSIDLSLPIDSLPMLAPLMLGILAMTNVEHNGKMMVMTTASAAGVKTATASSKVSQSLKSILNISRLSCIFFMGISTQAPILLSIYWISSQLYSLIQNLFLDWL